MNISHERAPKTANVLYVIFTVLYWLSIAVLALVAVGFLVQFILPESLFLIDSETFKFSFDNAIYFKASASGTLNIKSFVQIFLLFAIPMAVMLVVGLRHMRMILKNVKDGNPFCEANVRSLSVIGFDLIVAAFVVNFAELILLNHLLDLIAIKSVHMNYSANVPYLLAGILVLILAGIFNYGRFLKSEYDATV